MAECYYMRRTAAGEVAIWDRRDGNGREVATVHAGGIMEAMEMAERIVKMLNGGANANLVADALASLRQLRVTLDVDDVTYDAFKTLIVGLEKRNEGANVSVA